jgi:hypothetical protein
VFGNMLYGDETVGKGKENTNEADNVIALWVI